MNDFVFVKDLMLSKDTKPLLEQGNLITFLNKHVLFEFVNFYSK